MNSAVPPSWSNLLAGFVTPGLTRGPAVSFPWRMDRETHGGWLYMMADRYRGAVYVGVTSDLARRIHQHRSGDGSDFCARHELHRLVWAERGASILECIAHEKRMKKWRRKWKLALIERANPEWRDLYDFLV